MKVYLVHYFESGDNIERHFPTLEKAMEHFRMIKRMATCNTISVERIDVGPKVKENFCRWLDGEGYVRSREKIKEWESKDFRQMRIKYNF